MEFWPAAVELRGFNREEKIWEMGMHEGEKGYPRSSMQQNSYKIKYTLDHYEFVC